MDIRTTVPVLFASIAIVAPLLAGCGSSSKTATSPTAPAPIARNVSNGTPVTGSTGSPGAEHAPTMATGDHDRAGELCSGRDQAPYAREGLSCVTGRLKPKK